MIAEIRIELMIADHRCDLVSAWGVGSCIIFAGAAFVKTASARGLGQKTLFIRLFSTRRLMIVALPESSATSSVQSSIFDISTHCLIEKNRDISQESLPQSPE